MLIGLTRKISLLTTAIFLFLVACSGPQYEAEEATNKTYTIGHAGMGFASVLNPFNPLPDNSMRAIQKALRLGADGVEVDVQLSKDSVLILYHDNFLGSKTPLSGCIEEKLASEVLGQPYISDFPFNLLHDERIISLDSLFKYAKELDTFPQIHLDFHIFNYCNQKEPIKHWPIIVKALKKSIEKWEVPVNKIYPASNYQPILKALRESDSRYHLFYEEDSDYNKGLEVVIKNDFDGVLIKKKLIPDIEGREKARKFGKEVIYFGGKSKSDIQTMLQSYPNAIQVNNVKAMKSALND